MLCETVSLAPSDLERMLCETVSLAPSDLERMLCETVSLASSNFEFSYKYLSFTVYIPVI